MSPSFEQRAQNILRAAAGSVAATPDDTVWGPYRCFDGLFLAQLALDQREEGNRLLSETLDLIDRNVADEASGARNKWHLADFALHPVWRAYSQFNDRINRENTVRIERSLTEFLYHFGDLSENHNLLHLALRYFTASEWPEAIFRDGRPAAEHRAESRRDLIRWMAQWVSRGSSEWGADIYYNVNLLALLNLADFAVEEDMRRWAAGVADLVALDEALDAFAGAYCGSCRRGYACYRQRTLDSPSRPLHHLWFGTGGKEDFFVPFFIGGVIEAALSGYRPPEAVVKIAGWPEPFTSRATHRLPWQLDRLVEHQTRLTTRLPGAAQLSCAMMPATSERKAEFTWVAVLGEEAVVLGNHPAFGHKRSAVGSGTKSGGGAGGRTAELLRDYEENRFEPRCRPLWVPGNYPPGWPGETRPGYWQGNGCGPAACADGRTALLVYVIDPGAELPFMHVYLPREEFDEVLTEGHWIRARKGAGYLALWFSTAPVWVARGFWAGREVRCSAPCCGLLVEIGSEATDGSFEEFIAQTRQAAPVFNEETLELEARPEGAVWKLRRDGSWSKDGEPQPARFARTETPWGNLNDGALALDAGGARHRLDFADLLAASDAHLENIE